MKKLLFLFILVYSFLLFAEQDNIQVIQKIIDSTVLITTDNGLGAGFIANDKGLIVTNYHVISDSDNATVRLYDDRKFTCRSVLGNKDLFQKDIAFIKIDADGLSYLNLLRKRPIIGSKVIVVGHPNGNNWTYSEGKLNSSAYNEGGGRKEVSISANIFPGNSGGPICDEQGNVIGVSTILRLPSLGSLDNRIFFQYSDTFKCGVSSEEIVPFISDKKKNLNEYQLLMLAQSYRDALTAYIYMNLLEYIEPTISKIKDSVENARIVEQKESVPVKGKRTAYTDRGFAYDEEYTTYETRSIYSVSLNTNKLSKVIDLFYQVRVFISSPSFDKVSNNNSEVANKFRSKTFNGLNSFNDTLKNANFNQASYYLAGTRLQSFRKDYNGSISYFVSIAEGCVYCLNKYGDFLPNSDYYLFKAKKLKKKYQTFYVKISE